MALYLIERNFAERTRHRRDQPRGDQARQRGHRCALDLLVPVRRPQEVVLPLRGAERRGDQGSRSPCGDAGRRDRPRRSVHPSGKGRLNFPSPHHPVAAVCDDQEGPQGPMTTTTPVERASTSTSPLSDEMLARFDERAPGYDRDNQFFDEDFAELRASGFLDIAIPDRVRRRRCPPRRVLPAPPPTRLPRPGHRPRRQHARLLDRRRRRSAPCRRRLVPVHPRQSRGGRGALRPPRRARQRHGFGAVDVVGCDAPMVAG